MKQDLIKAIKFALVGVMNTLVDMAVFFVLTYFFKISPYTAQLFSYSAGTLNSYVVNRKFTFKTTQKFFSKQMTLFVMVNLIVLALTTSVIWFVCEILLLPIFFGKIFSVFAGLAVNFLLNRLLVFKNQ